MVRKSAGQKARSSSRFRNAVKIALGLVAIVVIPLLLAEFTELAPWLAERLTLRAARRLRSRTERERYSEEWLADVRFAPGKVTKLVVAAGHYIASVRLTLAPARREPDDHRQSNARRRRLALLMPGAVLVGVWYLASDYFLDERRTILLPPPDAVVRQAFLECFHRSEFLAAARYTILAAAVGLGVSSLLGLVAGVALVHVTRPRSSIYPHALLLQCVAGLSMTPLVGFWFGYGFASQVVAVVVTSVFSVISGTLTGLRSSTRAHQEMFALYRAGRLARLWKLQMPAALPAFLTGVQVAATLAVIGSVVGGTVFRQGDAGIGVLIVSYRTNLQTAELFGAAIAAALLGVLAFSIFGLLKRAMVGREDEPDDTESPART